MRKCHCLFVKRKHKVTALYEGNAGIELLKFKGEASVPYTDAYWEDWKNYSGYCKGDITDFCLLYDTEMELPEEYQNAQCDENDSIWTAEKIKSVSKMLGLSENIEVYGEDKQYILTISDSGRKANKIAMFSKHINQSDVKNRKEEEGELTPFIQYYVEEAKEEEL